MGVNLFIEIRQKEKRKISELILAYMLIIGAFSIGSIAHRFFYIIRCISKSIYKCFETEFPA